MIYSDVTIHIWIAFYVAQILWPVQIGATCNRKFLLVVRHVPSPSWPWSFNEVALTIPFPFSLKAILKKIGALSTYQASSSVPLNETLCCYPLKIRLNSPTLKIVHLKYMSSHPQWPANGYPARPAVNHWDTQAYSLRYKFLCSYFQFPVLY